MVDKAYQSLVNAYTREYTGPNNGNSGWAPEDPITAEKMNNVEAGIVEAIKLSNTNEASINNVRSSATTAVSTANAASELATTAYNVADSLRDGASGGSYAWTSIKNATDQSESTQALNNKLTAMSTNIGDIQGILRAAGEGHEVDRNPSMLKHFQDLDSTVNEQGTAIESIRTEIEIARQKPQDANDAWRLVDNFNAIRQLISNNTGDISSINTYITNNIETTIQAIQNKIGYTDAETINANPATNIKQIINTLKSDVQTYTDNKVSVINTHFSELEDRIAEIDGTGEGDNTLANRITAIEEEIDEANGDGTLDDRFDGIDSAIEAIAGNGGTIEGINSRIEAIDGQNGTVAALTTRVGTLETEVGPANASRIDAAASAITNLETEIGDAHRQNVQNDTLANRFAAIDTKIAELEAGAGENATATVVVDDATFDVNDKPILPNDEEPLEAIDYLIKKGDKYYYWKYINNTWELISGGGGSGNGTSSALILATLPAAAEADVNVDYYIGTNETGYLHYRFIDIEGTLTPVLIGVNPENIKTYNIDVGTETVQTEAGDSEVSYIYWYEFDYGEDNTDTESKTPTKIRLPAMGGGGGSYNANQKLVRITPRNITHALNSEDKVEIKFFYTSGNKGDGAKYTLVSGTTTIASEVAINSGDPEDQASTWPTKEVVINGETVEIPKTQNEVPMGFYSIDITDQCTAVTSGKTFRLTVVDTDDPTMSKTMAWEVVVINLAASTTLEATSINELGNSLTVPYTITGNVEKTTFFYLDDVKIGEVNLRASQSNSGPFTIPAQAAGAHRLEFYAQATVNGQTLTSNKVQRDIIWYDSSSQDIVIASPYRYRGVNDIRNLQQYQLLEIPYTIVGGATNSYVVEYFEDDLSASVDRVTLTNTNSGTWSYHANYDGDHTLYIKVGSTYIEIHIAVEQLDIDIAQVTDNLVIDFNPTGITNHSNRRDWTNGTYSLIVSENFDWFNGGYGSDLNGDYFLVKAGTRAKFNYKMFTSYISSANGVTSTNSTVFRDGAEMKIAFKTAAVRDADAVWFTNMGKTNDSAAAKQVGIQLNTHNGWLKTDAAADSTKSYLYFPYSEEDRIELDININPQTAKNAVYIMSYEDGCPSRAYPYNPTEALYQQSGAESEIIIGSDDCDVYIYRFRIYNAALDTAQVLRNFIADGKDVNDSIDRYNRNCIYYNTQTNEYTPYEGPDIVLDPERLALKIPDVKILMLDTPKFTTSKKDFIANSSLRCIHAAGGKIYPSRGIEDNWLFKDGYHSGQGTTSDKYGDAGRNLDFLFMCDGVHNPSDKVSVKKENFIPNYQSSVIFGYGMTDLQGNSLALEPQYCIDWKDEDTWKPNTQYDLLYTMSNGETHDMLVRYGGQVYKCLEAHTSGEEFDATKWELQEGYTSKVSLTSTSIPNNFFNLKVNIASSENVNNALFQKRYNDFLTYVSPAKLRDSRIKNDMEFVPAIIFVRENDTEFTEETINGETIRTYINHQEFNDTNWHFYALGNIGDSKKTDYTRAYDPEDMNEFTLEISDNNTNNSQFQSGVYMKNGVRTIEPYSLEQDMDEGEIIEGSFTAMSEENDITVETTDYLFPIDRETEWEALDENDQPLNMRYWSLMNEGFDGDHSFEMRYACKGDYRDGKVVNDTTGQAKAQLKLNEKVWRAFYTWLITTDDATFVNELDQWCVRSSVAFFYAFTHYYTMIDNRAKNTFWHFAKTGKHRVVSHPIKDMLHTYEEAVGNVSENATNPGVWEGTFQFTEDAEIDENKTYYTQYAFDMWVYDCDTAAGIDNNGELVFPYGKEDTDYRVDGDPTSGPVFNGAGSIFWARLRKNCNENIVAAFTGVPAECFNATHLITEFDKFQNCFPESIWRLDVERKYIRPFTGDDGATEESPNQPIFLTRQNTRFLGDMMQGRKKYQRRQWVKDQGVYFGSKYMLQNIEGNQLDMTCYTIGNQQVLPNWDLTITPYQDMYLNADYGETAIRGRRAKKNVPVEIKCPFSSMNESRVRIYGADYIRALAGKPIKDNEGNIIGAESLASFYFRGNDFSHTNKLRELYIGSSDPTYTNSQFTKLNIGSNNPILEVLDLQNCDGLGGSLNLSESTALQRLELQGTQFSQVVLPGSTGIRTLHLPETITQITLNAAKNLNELTIKTRQGVDNVSNLTTLQINDSDYSDNINWLTLAATTLPHIVDLQLINLIKASIQDITDMEPFVEKKEELGTTYDSEGNIINKVNITGIIKVLGDWSAVELAHYTEALENKVQFDTTNGHQVIKYTIQYKNYDGTLLYEDYRSYEDAFIDPAVEISPSTGEPLIEIPQKPSDEQYNYHFGLYDEGEYIPFTGWRNEDTNQLIYQGMTVSNDTVLIADYPEDSYEIRYYRITWYDGNGDPLLVSDPQRYGMDASNMTAPNKDGINAPVLPVTIGDAISGYKVFKGWNRPVGTVTSDINVYPLWEESTLDFTNPTLLDIDDINDLNAADLYGITQIRNPSVRETLLKSHLGYDIKYIKMGQDFDFDQVYAKSYNLIPDGSEYLYFSGGVNRTSVVPTTIARETKIYDGQTRNGVTLPAIYPLSTLDKDFTLAIDFKFLMDQNLWSNFVTAEYVIASCYKEYNGAINGFKITMQGPSSLASAPAIRITWGDGTTNETTYVRIDSMQYSTDGSAYTFNTYRNMIVLRHSKKQPERLFVSYMDPNSDLNNNVNNTSAGPSFYNISSGVVTKTLTWSSGLNVDTPLVLGGLYSTASAYQATNIEASQNRWPAKGVIYYAKYWEADLGGGNCSKLAAWPHQTVGFKISGFDDGREVAEADGHLVIGDKNTVKINFTAAQPIGDRYCDYKRNGTTCFTGDDTMISGWRNFDVRTFMNSSVFNAFPVVYQSLMKAVGINTKTQQAKSLNGTISPVFISETIDPPDNIYIPSFQEIATDGSNNDLATYSGEANHQWDWLKTASVNNLFGLDGNNNLVKTTATHINYLRLYFMEHSILPTARIFNMSASNNPYTLLDNTIYTIDGQTMKVRPGDIWYVGTTAYMYVSKDDVTTGAKIISSLDAESGYGWVESCIWATRTFDIAGSRQRSYGFIKTMKNGQITNEQGVDVTTTLTRALVPQFSI